MGSNLLRGCFLFKDCSYLSNCKTGKAIINLRSGALFPRGHMGTGENLGYGSIFRTIREYDNKATVESLATAYSACERYDICIAPEYYWHPSLFGKHLIKFRKTTPKFFLLSGSYRTYMLLNYYDNTRERREAAVFAGH